MPEINMQRIVVVGGGTGTYQVLTALKSYAVELSAIVTTADSGGSSGVLRSEFGVLPPGDIVRAMVALAEDSGIMKELMNYRFDAGIGLTGHRFGNLLLTALRDIVGSEENAILEAAKLLKLRGAVYPVTLDKVQLCAELEDGTIIKGESAIDKPAHSPRAAIRRVWLEPAAHAYYTAVRALERADGIVLGPGDLYSSVIPNLLVSGIPEAIASSTAKKIYVCNLMTKHGETDGFDVHDFVRTLCRYLSPATLDLVIYNTAPISEQMRERYRLENSKPVEQNLAELKIESIGAPLVRETDIVRHDGAALAKLIVDYLARPVAKT